MPQQLSYVSYSLYALFVFGVRKDKRWIPSEQAKYQYIINYSRSANPQVSVSRSTMGRCYQYEIGTYDRVEELQSELLRLSLVPSPFSFYPVPCLCPLLRSAPLNHCCCRRPPCRCRGRGTSPKHGKTIQDIERRF